MRCLLALVLLSLWPSSCSRSDTRPSAVDAAPAPAPAPSPAPVTAHCGSAPCRDYPAASAYVRTLATPGHCTDASIGRCGALRYVAFSDGFSAFEEYFDAKGAMIAAHTRADIDPAGGWSGPAQSCEKVPEVVLCRGGDLDAGMPSPSR